MRNDERDYRERFVAFMDVLGFSQLVRNADKHPHQREVILTIIRSLRTTLAEVPPTSFQFTQFSDCIVISADRSRDGLLAVFSGCAALVTDLLQMGVLLRGGIALGNLVHTSEILYGTGLLSAYSHDGVGGNPRIVLDDDVVDDARKEGLDVLVRPDHYDLTPMLHTLWEFENFDPKLLALPALAIAGAKIARIISPNSGDLAQPASVRAKWRWMRTYWNDSITAKGHLPVVT